mmetsp:Transcript_15268/g.41829  ORF Transcript_15268/g.41829 Transcript_15268/m.41829 type:complete len:86 (-) Transcript_15268:24-281(-)
MSFGTQDATVSFVAVASLHMAHDLEQQILPSVLRSPAGQSPAFADATRWSTSDAVGVTISAKTQTKAPTNCIVCTDCSRYFKESP